MAQPTPYVITTDFSDEEASGVAGRSTLRNPALDVEFNNIKTTLSQVLSNLTLIQRDDGRLADASVSVFQLASDVITLIGSAGFVVRGNWVTATAYAVKDVVKSGTGTYLCVVAHTSGVFATDLAADKWTPLFDAAALVASGITFTPTGTIAATNVQNAIAEAANEAVQKASNGSDFANLATTRTNMSVFSKAEVQASSSIVANAAGTVDAITAGFTPALAGWTDDQLLIVECAGANTSTTPTFNPDGAGAKTIVRPDGTALTVGDIPGANFRALFVYDASLDKVLLLNPHYTTPASAVPTMNGFSTMINGTIVTSRAGNAETISVKTLAGTDPTAADPVYFVFRNATLATGDYTVITVTAALSITVSSGSTLGATNSAAFRIWLVAFNDAGTLRLGVINRSSSAGGMSLTSDLLQSSTAEGGAGAADSGNVIYTGTAVATKALQPIAYLDYTLAAVGTWNTAPSKVQLADRNTQDARQFISAEQTITSAGALTLAHGLGTNPHSVSVWLKCLTAEYNYTVGMKLRPLNTNSDSGTDNRGISLVVDSTNVSIRFGTAAVVFNQLDRITGAWVGLTNANWALVVEAFV